MLWDNADADCSGPMTQDEQLALAQYLENIADDLDRAAKDVLAESNELYALKQGGDA